MKIFTARIHPLNTVLPADEKVTVLAYQVLERNPELSRDAVRSAVKDAIAIRRFCQKYLGQVLDITNVKDHGMIVVYDDRAIRVEKNTGNF